MKHECDTNSILQQIRVRVRDHDNCSAYKRGVIAYANDLIDDLADAIEGGYFKVEDIGDVNLLEKQLLNGASSWRMYSYGGCSLIYDGDITERLCCPSRLRKKGYGELPPNGAESWLDIQATALSRAATRIKCAARQVFRENVAVSGK